MTVTWEVNTMLPPSRCRLPTTIPSLRNGWRLNPLVISGSTTNRTRPMTIPPPVHFYPSEPFISSQERCPRRSTWLRRRLLRLHQNCIDGRAQWSSIPTLMPKRSKFTTIPSRNNLPLRITVRRGRLTTGGPPIIHSLTRIPESVLETRALSGNHRTCLYPLIPSAKTRWC